MVGLSQFYAAEYLIRMMLAVKMSFRERNEDVRDEKTRENGWTGWMGWVVHKSRFALCQL